ILSVILRVSNGNPVSEETWRLGRILRDWEDKYVAAIQSGDLAKATQLVEEGKRPLIERTKAMASEFKFTITEAEDLEGSWLKNLLPNRTKRFGLTNGMKFGDLIEWWGKWKNRSSIGHTGLDFV